MFGPRITTVFASRWKALWWSAGILMTAYCSIPAAEQARDSGAKQVAASARDHVSPWAKQP
jgi:hypothetical protein